MWQAMNEVVATVGIGIRERLLGLCDAMETRLHGLRDSKRRVSEDVHEARKLGKSLRGGLVLVGMPAETLLAVQAVGRLLAGQRDAVSRRKTWGCLGWEDSPHAHDPAVRAVEALLGKLARAAGRRPPDETVVWAQARIGRYAGRWQGVARKDCKKSCPMVCAACGGGFASA